MSNQNPSREGCAVISDGYTRPAYIAGVPFTTPAVRFSYRPPLIVPLSIIRREMQKAAASLVPEIQARAICKYVERWDVKDSGGEPVPLNPKAMMEVDPYVFNSVSAIVLGLQFTDIDPEWTKDEAESESARELDSVFNGDVAAAEESDVKN